MRHLKSRLLSGLLFTSALLFAAGAATAARADTVTYTFESPQFTAGQTTPLLNRAPNVGSSAFLTSFISGAPANGFRVEAFALNSLFAGNSLFEPGGIFGALTISFSVPVDSVQFAFGINLASPIDPLGQLRLTSPVGSQNQTAANVGGIFQGGTFTFSSLTPFTTIQLAAFTSTGAAVEFGIDNLTLTYTPLQPIPEPTTMLLLGTGLAGVGGMVRRQRKAKAE